MQIRFRRRRRREGGQALAEFSLIAPLLIILIFGFIDTARLYEAWVTVQHASREAARYGVTGRSDCAAPTPTRVDCIKYIAESQAGGLANTSSDLSVHLQSWQYPGYSDPPTADDAGQQCDALEVRVEYDFTPSTPLMKNIFGPLHLQARQRMVNEPFGPCS